jgi:hypothetical protein
MTGKPSLSLLMICHFVTFRNGLIVNYREYWNPQAFQKAMTGGSFDKK